MTGTLKHHTSTKDLVGALCPQCEGNGKLLYYRSYKPAQRVPVGLYWCITCEVPFNEFQKILS